MLRVGLTGGIASGKSLVARFFKENGARLIDADRIARDVVQPGSAGWKRVVDCFGTSVLRRDGRIDRRALGRIAFSDERARKALNGLLHPLIISKIQQRLEGLCRRLPDAPVVIEVPLLIECGLQHDFDRIVLVAADPEIQKKRLISRSRLSEEEAEARIGSQLAMNQKRKYADYIIDNNGTRRDLKRQVRCIYKRLVADSHRTAVQG